LNWVNLATAPDQLTAELWVAILRDNDIPALIPPSDSPSFLGVTTLSVRVLVGEGDVARSKEVLAGLDEGGTRGH
jgi:hypothetical protein